VINLFASGGVSKSGPLKTDTVAALRLWNVYGFFLPYFRRDAAGEIASNPSLF